MQLHTTTALGNDAFRYKKKYNAFMGISIRNKYFTKDTMREYFLWLDEYFQETVILLMDDPDRYNLMVFKDVSEERALTKTREISDYVKSAYEKIKRQYNINSIQVVQFKDFNEDPLYIDTRKQISSLVNQNQIIQNSLVRVMEENTRVKLHEIFGENSSTIIQAKQKELLLKYITDEFIAIIFFLRKGYLIEIDPHVEFLTKRLFYEASVTSKSQTLGIPNRGHIYISPPGRFYLNRAYYGSGITPHIYK
jgi:tRNA-dependent cyclodipeptide synthase